MTLHIHRLSLAITALNAAILLPAYGQPAIHAFDSSPRPSPYILTQAGNAPGPTPADGALRILDGHPDESNTIAFNRTAAGLSSHIEATWDMRIQPGADGISFALLSSNRYGVKGPAPKCDSWEAPNLPGVFAVGFDVWDPPTQNPFNADRNINDQPPREISIHWDGVEIVRRLSPVEFRGDQFIPIALSLQFVTGGADVTLRVNGTPVYDHYFVPGLLPFESRVAFGARTGAVTTVCDIRQIHVAYSGRTRLSPPVTVPAIDRQLLDSKHARESAVVTFPKNTDRFGRIILTLTLAEPPGGYDPWDRKAAVYLYDNKGQRFEILRFITPYHRGYTWKVDVSDYRPLLIGSKKVEAWCETYASGWLASVSFDFYPGPSALKAYRVENLWVGEPEIGNPDKPISQFFTPKTIHRDPHDAAVKLRFTVTGHGMAPNSGNAGEFLPLKRTVTVGPASFQNLLWKTDNYLNPCRPQGGTWKYDRAGWGPGDVVTPWTIDVSSAVPAGQSATVTCVLDPYLNTNRGKTYAPTHWIEAQAIFYRK